MTNGTISVSNTVNGKELPIYCVDTQEPKISISFDAALGNDDTSRILEILDRHDFIPNLRVGELAHIFVVLTMIAKIVSGFIDCPDIIRVRFYPAAGHEKRGMYVVFGQNFQNT